MVLARPSKKSGKNKNQKQENNDHHEDRNDNNNGGAPGEIQSRSDLPVLPTRMEVRRARINEKKSKKEVKNRQRDGDEGATKKSVVIDASVAGSASNPFSAGSLLASAREGGKNKKKLMRDKTGRTGGVRGAPSLRSRTETTQNLSDKQREKIFVSEIQNIQKVQEHPAFQADPLGSLQMHLQGTARLLQAPNAECRREPQQKKPQQQQFNQQQQPRFNNNNNNFGGRR